MPLVSTVYHGLTDLSSLFYYYFESAFLYIYLDKHDQTCYNTNVDESRPWGTITVAAASRILCGKLEFLLASRLREVMRMNISFAELIAFATFIVHLIDLVVRLNHKKK